jgi:hypothetical protein
MEGDTSGALAVPLVRFLLRDVGGTLKVNDPDEAYRAAIGSLLMMLLAGAWVLRRVPVR